MSLFLSVEERAAIHELRKKSPVAEGMYWALLNRADRRAASVWQLPGIVTTDWWHNAAEFLADTAMAHALKASPKVAAWLRASALGIARRPLDDWIGPAFRDHASNPPRGHLETAHLTWGIALVLDLAPEIFTESEREELKEALGSKAAVLCLEWLDRNSHLANWRCVLTAGMTLAAVSSGNKNLLPRVVLEYNRCLEIFQPDGTYGESLQYGNYAACTQILTRESLIRSGWVSEEQLPLAPIALMPIWQAYSYFYRKPMRNSRPRARSANFNDSAANFRPSADFLLTIAARCKLTHPTEAGLAKWLFDTLYTPMSDEEPHDLASFGFVNDFGFLAITQLPHAAKALCPEELNLPAAKDFQCGDVFARDGWNGRTVLAIHGTADPLHAAGHLHGDRNSFILVHNEERLLVDPGHSCYRNLIRELDISTKTHNTCQFKSADGRVFEQRTSFRRVFDKESGVAEAPITRQGNRQLLTLEGSNVTCIVSECAALYGEPIQEFTRILFLCGSRALFVVDKISASAPVTTTWNWLLNNRDGILDLKVLHDRLVVRRGTAGMKLFHLGKSQQRVVHAHVHDYYHPLPAQEGEGRPGSGQLVHWTETQPVAQRTMIHAICLDHYGTVAGWHFKPEPEWPAVLEGPQRSEIWKLRLDSDSIWIENTLEGSIFEASQNSDKLWHFQRR